MGKAWHQYNERPRGARIVELASGVASMTKIVVLGSIDHDNETTATKQRTYCGNQLREK